MDKLCIRYLFEVVDGQLDVTVCRYITTDGRRLAKPSTIVQTYPLKWVDEGSDEDWREVALSILADYFGDMEKARKMSSGFHVQYHYKEGGFTVTDEDIKAFVVEFEQANQKAA